MADKFDITDLSVCSDCIMIFANGEINDGEDTEESIVAAQEIKWGHMLQHIVQGADVLGFSHSECDGCGAHAGDRFRAHLMIPIV